MYNIINKVKDYNVTDWFYVVSFALTLTFLYYSMVTS